MRARVAVGACALLATFAGCKDVGVVGEQAALTCPESCEPGERCDSERGACVPCEPGSACALPPPNEPDASDDDDDNSGTGSGDAGSGSSGSSGSGQDEPECQVDDEECTPCTTTATCDDGLECLEGLCRECIADADCDPLEVCELGLCEDADEL